MKKLLAGLLAAYIVQLVLEIWLDIPVASLLALNPAGKGLWQLVTYVLVDRGHPLMFLIGLLFIWWALSPFEIGYGPLRTVQLCGASVLSASIPAYLFGFVIPGSPPLYGSGPLWFGAVAATTWLHRDQPLSLFGAVRMTAKQFLWLLLGISLLTFLQSKNHTHLIADLGSITGGIAFVRWMKRPRRPGASRGTKPRPRGFKVIEGGNDDNRPKWLN